MTPSSTPPDWIQALAPVAPARLAPLLASPDTLVWHINVTFDAWPVPAGLRLTGADTWNGKALIIPSDSRIPRSVGEVELTERLRRAFPRATVYWTAGGPPALWRDWALPKKLREPWLLALDRQIRQRDPLIASNDRGWPDVLWWLNGASDLRAVEYKGPSPTAPNKLDQVKVVQEAWYRSALAQRILDEQRYVVAQWVPSPEAVRRLREQAAASRAGREDRDVTRAP